MKVLINSFNVGEVTPTLFGRVELESMRRACAKLENFVPNVLGGAFRRPPFLRVGAPVASGPCRLLPFNYSATTKFVIELTAGKMRFWRGDGSTLVGTTLDTPWGADELDAVQFSQVNDVVFFAHPNHSPRRLIRFADTDWRLADLFDNVVTPVAPTIAGEAGKLLLEWWTGWTPAMPIDPPTVTAVRDNAEWLKPPTGSVDVTTLNLAVGNPQNQPNPSGTTRFMRRIVGKIIIPADDTYRFYLGAGDGAALFIGGVFRLGLTMTTATAEANVTLTAGTYAFELVTWDIGANPHDTRLQVSWTGQPKIDVPPAWFQKNDTTGPLGELATVAKWPPFLDENLSATTLEIDTATVGTGRTLTASADLFQAGHVGAYFQIGHYRDALSVELTYADGATNQAGSSGTMRVKGKWEFLSVGIWSGNVFIEEQNAAGGWDIIRRFTGKKDRNVTTSGEAETETVLRIRVSALDAFSSSDVDQPRFILEAAESLVWGLVKVTAVTNATEATVDVISSVYSTTATTTWAEGAWSNVRGFPRAVALHESRLWYASTRQEPQKLWSSVSGDFLNFRASTLADGAIVLQISAVEANPILWMASQTGLILGTRGDEWLLDGGAEGLRPDNATAKRQSRYGSEAWQAILAGNAVLFIQRGGQMLAEYVYQFAEDSYVAPDITKLVPHMTRQGLRAIAYAQNPDSTLWATTNAGTLLSCTYQRAEQVVAWARHPVGGTVESVCTVYGDVNAADEVWIVAVRDGVRSIERLDPAHWTRLHERTEPVFHLDSAVIARGTALTSVSGLDHLEGKAVGVITDNGEHADAVVAGGAVTLSAPATFAAVGLVNPAVLKIAPLEVPLNDGTAQGRKWKVSSFTLRLYETASGVYRDRDGGEEFVIFTREVQHEQNDPPPPFSGFVELANPATFNGEVGLTFISRGGLALNLVSIIPNLGIYGD